MVIFHSYVSLPEGNIRLSTEFSLHAPNLKCCEDKNPNRICQNRNRMDRCSPGTVHIWDHRTSHDNGDNGDNDVMMTHLDFRMLMMHDYAGSWWFNWWFIQSEQIACIVVFGITAALPANSSAAWLRKPNPESWHVSFVPGPIPCYMLNLTNEYKRHEMPKIPFSIFFGSWNLVPSKL